MNFSFRKPVLGALLVATLSCPFVASADSQTQWRPRKPTLVDRVHDAADQFVDINYAFKAGWKVATPCVSGPQSGAMGVHLTLDARVGDGLVNPDEPEALIYEPLPNGRWRLVGVEFIVLADQWNAAHPSGPAPSVDGHLMNLVGMPNRYGLPSFFELHVWAFEDNPDGSFSDWNVRVTCEEQRGAEDSSEPLAQWRRSKIRMEIQRLTVG